jgi:hypothetical protein
MLERTLPVLLSSILSACCEVEYYEILRLERADVPLIDCNGDEWDTDGSGPDIAVMISGHWYGRFETIYSSEVIEDDYQPEWEEEVCTLNENEDVGKEITIEMFDIDEEGGQTIGAETHLLTHSDFDAGGLSISISCVVVELTLAESQTACEVR